MRVLHGAATTTMTKEEGGGVELFPLYEDDEDKNGIIRQCVTLLNWEWPRNEKLRLRSIHTSTSDLPACFALILRYPPTTPPVEPEIERNDKKATVPLVLGHVRLARITSDPSAVWIESVIIRPELRGRGWGKYLMLKTEDYAKKKYGFQKAYLSTIDRQLFYSKIGYSFSDPVTAFTGNVKLPVFNSKNSLFNHQNPSDKNLIINPKKKSIKSSPKLSSTIPPSPPPPPPPPPLPSTGGGDASSLIDISKECARHFKKLSIKDIAEEPSLPPSLTSESVLDKNSDLNESSSTCRALIHKDFMKKDLN